ncbi:avidin/streptavidin family protein [Kordiimonas gwangyangensis]|uniref:avidin/streptavidin family protein n=1 Tax=Kordiimonas gwangyangensis TaxID=288022 RepID=UPI00037DE7E7|nr:avidin/streptavidin family protein [Kordiimonas gwangyangensis]
MSAIMRTAFAAACLSTTIALPAAARDCSNMTGQWTTNLGATVSFDRVDAKTGMITGRYFSASMPDRAFPLTGFVNANGREEDTDRERHYAPAVSFAVSFEEFGGITSWTGICLMNGDLPQIETEDLIIAPMADYDWSHVIDNHDSLKAK